MVRRGYGGGQAGLGLGSEPQSTMVQFRQRQHLTCFPLVVESVQLKVLRASSIMALRGPVTKNAESGTGRVNAHRPDSLKTA